MSKIKEGDVVMTPTQQAGTLVDIGKDRVCVLLANLDLWFGPYSQVWLPTSQEELDSALVEVDRFKDR